MATTRRIELFGTAEEKDISKLLDLAKKVSQGELAEAVAEFSRRQLQEFWRNVLQLCTTDLLEESETDLEVKRTLDIVSCVVSLARTTVKCLLSRTERGDGSDIQIPEGLQELVIILHKILPSLLDSGEEGEVKNKLSQLFELWWTSNLPGKEELVENTVCFLLNRATQPKAYINNILRLRAIRDVLSVYLESTEGGDLIPLLQKCIFHSNFVPTTEGNKFLSFLFTLNIDLTHVLHQTVKNHLLNIPTGWQAKYGHMYLTAWRNTEGHLRTKIEECVQDLINRCVHGQRGPTDVFRILLRMLEGFNSVNSHGTLGDLMCRLYNPILWRSLKVPNNLVRLNAASLFFLVFPLVPTRSNTAETEGKLQEQFDHMHTLLGDVCQEVRQVAVEGIGRVVDTFWEIIPGHVIQSFMARLVGDLIYDSSSPGVRVAVIRVMTRLCDNHLSMPVLEKLLPQLQNFVHDKSERVRLAMYDLLLKVKKIRPIKFWHVVPVEHILPCLASDTDPIVRRIMKLLVPSFATMDDAPSVVIDKCVSLINDHPAAARVFFTNLPNHISLSECRRYIIILCQYVLQMSPRCCQNKGKQEPEITRKQKETHSGKQRKTDDKKEMSMGSDEDEDTEVTVPCSRSSTNLDLNILKFLLEGICLMYTGISAALASPENIEIKQDLNKKLMLTVRELTAIKETPEILPALVCLASNLPEKASGRLSQHLLQSLRDGFVSEDSNYSRIAIKALIRWGKAESVLNIFMESLESVLKRDDGSLVEENSDIEQVKKRKTVVFAESTSLLDPQRVLDLIGHMISFAECRPILSGYHQRSLLELMELLMRVMIKARRFLEGKSSDSPAVIMDSVNLYVNIYIVFFRLATFMCIKGESQEEGEVPPSATCDSALKYIQSAVIWSSDCVMPYLDENAGKSSKQRQELATRIMFSTLKHATNMLMIDTCYLPLLEDICQLCSQIVQRPWQHLSLTEQALSFVYQLTQVRHFREEQGAGEEKKLVEWQLVVKCLCTFIDTHRQHSSSSKSGDNNAVETDQSQHSANISQNLVAIKPVLAEILNELVKYCVSKALVTDFMNHLVSCMIEESTDHSRTMDGIVENLPVFSDTFVSILSRPARLKRLCLAALLTYIQDQHAKTIHHFSAIVALLEKLTQAEERAALPEVLLVTLLKGLDAVSITDSEISSGELKKRVESQLKKWRSSSQ